MRTAAPTAPNLRHLPQGDIHSRVISMMAERINPTKEEYIYDKLGCNSCVNHNPDPPTPRKGKEKPGKKKCVSRTNVKTKELIMAKQTEGKSYEVPQRDRIEGVILFEREERTQRDEQGRVSRERMKIVRHTLQHVVHSFRMEGSRGERMRMDSAGIDYCYHPDETTAGKRQGQFSRLQAELQKMRNESYEQQKAMFDLQQQLREAHHTIEQLHKQLQEQRLLNERITQPQPNSQQLPHFANSAKQVHWPKALSQQIIDRDNEDMFSEKQPFSMQDEMLLGGHEANTPYFAWYDQRNSSPSIAERIQERPKQTERTEGETSRMDGKEQEQGVWDDSLIRMLHTQARYLEQRCIPPKYPTVRTMSKTIALAPF